VFPAAATEIKKNPNLSRQAPVAAATEEARNAFDFFGAIYCINFW
jgi:hypothetical protein